MTIQEDVDDILARLRHALLQRERAAREWERQSRQWEAQCTAQRKELDFLRAAAALALVHLRVIVESCGDPYIVEVCSVIAAPLSGALSSNDD